MSIYIQRQDNPSKFFKPRDRDERIFKLAEEIGEVLHILGKCGRFGPDSTHPYVVMRTNIKELQRELIDLEKAIAEVQLDINHYLEKK